MTVHGWTFGSLIVVLLIFIGSDRTTADTILFDIPSMEHLLVPCRVSPSNSTKIVTWNVNGPIVAQETLSNPKPNCSAKYCVEFGAPYALKVSNVSVNDSGEYRCTLMSSDYSFTEMKNVVVVRQAPDIPTIVPANLNVLEDSPFVLTCYSTGHPAPTVTWYNDWVLLQKNATVTAQATGKVVGNLVFIPSYADDGAAITCVTQNELGIKNSTVHLNVSYGPRSIETGTSPIVSALAGERVSINCSAKGKPTPTVSWKYADSSGTYFLSSDTGTASLTISSLRKRDAGTYICIASNNINSSSVNITLYIMYGPSQPILRSNSTSYASGDNITLTCITYDEGNPPALYNWTKDGAWIPTILPYYVLNLPFAALNDSGSYSCIASNIAGWKTSGSFNLSVYAKPVVSIFLRNTIGYIGQPTMISCTADANPAPTVYWIRNTSFVQRETTKVYSTSRYSSMNVLHIDSVEQSDYGTYACYANNSIGNDSMTVELVQPSVPQSPWNLSIVAAKWSSVMLAWNPSFNGGYEQWFVLYSNSSTLYNGSASSCTLTGLSAGVHVIFVEAHNALGKSNSCPPVVASLKEGPSSSGLSFLNLSTLQYSPGNEYCLELWCSSVAQPTVTSNCTSVNGNLFKSVPQCNMVAVRWCLVELKHSLCGSFTNYSTEGDRLQGVYPLFNSVSSSSFSEEALSYALLRASYGLYLLTELVRRTFV